MFRGRVTAIHFVGIGGIGMSGIAEVLLSESFVAGHCFHTEPWTRDGRDWVGVGFSPASARRNLVDIEGTLWLDRASAELRLLEYRYANMPREIRDAHRRIVAVIHPENCIKIRIFVK